MYFYSIILNLRTVFVSWSRNRLKPVFFFLSAKGFSFFLSLSDSASATTTCQRGPRRSRRVFHCVTIYYAIVAGILRINRFYIPSRWFYCDVRYFYFVYRKFRSDFQAHRGIFSLFFNSGLDLVGCGIGRGQFFFPHFSIIIGKRREENYSNGFVVTRF